jgi:hypothetical protein
MTRPRRHRRAIVRRDDGQVSAFVVVTVAAVVALAGLVLDAGYAVAAKARTVGIAQAAARAGAQQLDLAEYRRTGLVRLDTDAATDAAYAWLSQSGVTGAVTATTQQVRVEITRSVETQLLGLVGVTTITIHAEATAQAVRSDTG